MNTKNSVLCYGGLHYDRLAHCLDDFQLGASNPVRSLAEPGGVASNIARNLANLNVQVGIASLLGEDSDGDQLLATLTQCGVDTSLTQRNSSCTTAGYTAVLDKEGELALGLADMDIYDRFDPAHLEHLLAPSLTSNWWLVDANLPADTLNHIGLNKRDQTLCAAPVSPSKAKRWRGNLYPVDIFAGNRREASVLTDSEISTTNDASVAARALQSQGPELVLITLGPDGVVMAEGNSCAHWSIPRTSVCDVNGAGDALYAGFIAARVDATRPVQALRQGIALASLTAEQSGAVIDIEPETLHERMALIAPPTLL